MYDVEYVHPLGWTIFWNGVRIWPYFYENEWKALEILRYEVSEDASKEVENWQKILD